MITAHKPDFNRLRKVLLRLGEPDIVPFYELLADQEVICAATGKTSYPENAVDFFYSHGFDFVPLSLRIDYNLPTLAASDTAELSKKTREFYDENNGVIQTREDFDSFNWPSVNSDIIRHAKKTTDMLPDGMKAILHFRSVFENVCFIMGLVPLSYAVYDNLQLVLDIIEKLGNNMLNLMKLCLNELDIKKIGAFTLCEDMGYLSGTMLDPDFLRKFIFPWEKKAVDFSHDHDIPVILHSCGNLKDVMDDLIDYVGFDAKHSFEDKIMPVCEAKKIYGNRIALLGGADMNVICTSDEIQLREYVRNIIKCCAPGGAYAFGTGNSVANYVPLENYRIMLDEARKEGIYPIQ